MGKASRSQKDRRAREEARRAREEKLVGQAKDEGWPVEELTDGIGMARATVELPPDEEGARPIKLTGTLISWTTPDEGSQAIRCEVVLSHPALAPPEEPEKLAVEK